MNRHVVQVTHDEGISLPVRDGIELRFDRARVTVHLEMFLRIARPGRRVRDQGIRPGLLDALPVQTIAPQMIEDQVDLHDGDILLIRTGYGQYGWNSPDSDEFRYMIKHPGPSPEFSQWCVERNIKWLGIDCVAMEHPMNTIQRVFHPKTFDEANQKLQDQFGQDWDEMFPLDTYYQDMHLNLFPKGIVHAENLGNQLAEAETGRYYIAAFIQKGMELASCWGRFVAFR